MSVARNDPSSCVLAAADDFTEHLILIRTIGCAQPRMHMHFYTRHGAGNLQPQVVETSPVAPDSAPLWFHRRLTKKNGAGSQSNKVTMNDTTQRLQNRTKHFHFPGPDVINWAPHIRQHLQCTMLHQRKAAWLQFAFAMRLTALRSCAYLNRVSPLYSLTRLSISASSVNMAETTSSACIAVIEPNP
ncbi:uncharacterized protein MYCFIDRAFT_175385 [Pseudocercospora fijiensis CIRAD86]|uniref:Uncharacterized protein n=1 Tax=Pseudocercospora fijiensis (strain CIRAD86) TaxID=383855 RepID=M3AXH9_PSEFD|nr:uncharacterized protein MYCFIDRAFT_175385 [Pseudocercospora fijiensis CIRAD86]EME81798.1 hypothetical protein MYCFIDRAFT_175385 [Pseudocercospora fijiensis CIRAD86]